MLFRLRQFLLFSLAASIGYFIGNGPFAEWVIDSYHMLMCDWGIWRMARSPNDSSLPLLIAGFLLGQGIYLFVRRVRANIEPMRARKAERIAAWDPALLLATRFGLHRYLEQCVLWAAEDPTSRTQSLALFKIRGLGKLNERQGTLVTTQLLRRIAVELRAESLPESASRLQRWFVRYLPRPQANNPHAVPPARYPARWSGATFALAFRELDAAQAVSISREMAAWIRGEIAALGSPEKLELVSAIAIGIPSVSSRGLAAAATQGLQIETTSLITVVHDPSDVRANIISQMSDVAHQGVEMIRRGASEEAASISLTFGRRCQIWLKMWGTALGCVVAALLTLFTPGVTGSIQVGAFFWPDNLDSVQVVDRQGPRTVRLVRSQAEVKSSGGWQLSDTRIIQGDPADTSFSPCQIHVTVTNFARHSYYVSAYDFEAVDGKGRHLTFDPRSMARFAQGLTGRWLDTGESWSAWLRISRLDAPISEVVFEPDKETRIAVEAAH